MFYLATAIIVSRIMQCTDAIIRGTAYTITFRLKDEANEPVDITGYKLFFTAKKNLADTDADAFIVIDVDPGDITNPTQGEHIFELKGFPTNPGDRDSTDIPPGSYFWDVKWLDTNGNPGAIPHKKLKIVENVTDRIS